MERSRFFNRRAGDAAGDYTYSSDDFAEFLCTFFSTGVVGTSGLKVSSNGTQVTVSTGYAILAGHWYNNDTALKLSNPLQSNKKRKDRIALKLDKEERSINAVWISGGTDNYPALADSSNVKYLHIADVDILSGGTIKAVYDRRTYSQALYTMSLAEFKSQFNTFLNACDSSYNSVVSQTTTLSEVLQARGGFDTLSHRLEITDKKHEDITEPATDNLFDCTKATDGWLDQYGSIEAANVPCYTTDFIAIQPGNTVYFYNRIGEPVAFEAVEFYRNKSASGLIKSIQESGTSCVNDCDGVYFRADFKVSDVAADDLQITLSDVAPTRYVPYQIRIKPAVINATSYSMDYVQKNVLLGPEDIYRVGYNQIAGNVTAKLHITYGGGNSQLVRADGKSLIDTITNKVIDRTMTDVEITADDLIAGLQFTEGGSIQIGYYNKSCEDLFNRIAGNSDTQIVTPTYEAIAYNSDDFETVIKEEVEI